MVKRLSKSPAVLSICLVILVVCSVLAYDLSKEQIVYEVPGAHLDTQWQWDLATTIGSFLPNTYNTNFAYFTQYPEYKFNFEGATRYWMIKMAHPASYTTLTQYVKSGQWCVAGGGAEPGDVNLPSAEALIRNYLYGNNFFMDEFGKRSIDVYLPDCFGFGYQLPTIAAHCGLKGFSTQKFDLWGGWFPTPFPIGRWYGVDSSFLIATLKPGAYSGGMDIRSADGDWLKAHSGAPGV
jgi:alpha-mannosidase